MISWPVYLARGCEAKTPLSTTAKSSCVKSDDLATRLGKMLAEMGLSRFSTSIAIQYLSSRLNDASGQGFERMKRVISYLLDELNQRSNTSRRKHSSETTLDGAPIDWQRGCPNLISGLRAIPVWDHRSICTEEEFPWLSSLEAAAPDVLEELNNLRGKRSFQPYRAPSSSSSVEGTESAPEDSLGSIATDTGEWNVSYLHLHGMDFSDNLAKCPKTARLIE
jgi:aspartate beta-hydroxylase